jgi:hypothetical protein
MDEVQKVGDAILQIARMMVDSPDEVKGEY